MFKINSLKTKLVLTSIFAAALTAGAYCLHLQTKSGSNNGGGSGGGGDKPKPAGKAVEAAVTPKSVDFSRCVAPQPPAAQAVLFRVPSTAVIS